MPLLSWEKKMFVYLDNSATTKPYTEVVAGMTQYLTADYGNPSSLHRMGMTGEKALKNARKSIASSLLVKDEEIYFTSGGTEADNLALVGAAQARKRRGNKIITTVIEHPAILETCKSLENQGFEVVYIPVDQNGILDMSLFEQTLDEKTILISIMQTNNETGSIQPLYQIGELKKHANKRMGTDIIFHTDAVQSYGKMDQEISKNGIDLLSISGHKIHGPKGIGALFCKKEIVLRPIMNGGGQERGLRSGTENVPSIVGFQIAADLAKKNQIARLKSMNRVKQYLKDGILSEIPDVRLNSLENSVSSILNVSFLGVRGEVLLHTLEQSEIYVSTGSACSSRKKGQSHVLKAMGLQDHEIEGAIRFSFNEFHTVEEMDFVLIQLKNAVLKFRKLGKFR